MSFQVFEPRAAYIQVRLDMNMIQNLGLEISADTVKAAILEKKSLPPKLKLDESCVEVRGRDRLVVKIGRKLSHTRIDFNFLTQY